MYVRISHDLTRVYKVISNDAQGYPAKDYHFLSLIQLKLTCLLRKKRGNYFYMFSKFVLKINRIQQSYFEIKVFRLVIEKKLLRVSLNTKLNTIEILIYCVST